MGIYDREYYRREGPSFLGSFTDQGRVCKWLIAINVLLYVVQITTDERITPYLDVRLGSYTALSDEELVNRYELMSGGLEDSEHLPPEVRESLRQARQEQVARLRQLYNSPGILQGQVWRLLTYAFLHGGILHILFNMLFLWWFGHEMEELYGPREFLTFYLMSALLGGVAYFLWAWARGSLVPCIGASGAVTAVMVLYAFHYPRRIIYIWFLPLPVWLFVLFQVGQDALTFVSNQPTRTAVVVHLAGAAFGLGYYKFNWRLAPWWQALLRFRLPRARPRLRVVREEPDTPVSRPAAPPQPVASAAIQTDIEHLEAKVDAVLEKVARYGRDSLTESERELLVRASEVYRRKQKS